MGPFNFISILLSEMPFEAVAFGKRLSGISGTAARRRMEAKSRSNRPRSLRLFSINSDAASCGRAPDCKIDWARKIHPRGCPTLLNGEETAIGGAAKFTRIQSAPRIRIVGESAGGRYLNNTVQL